VNVSLGVGASQRVNVAHGVLNWVEHDGALPITDVGFDDGTATAVRVVVPEVVEPAGANNCLVTSCQSSPCRADSFSFVASLMMSRATHRERATVKDSSLPA